MELACRGHEIEHACRFHMALLNLLKIQAANIKVIREEEIYS
jgi:hypothetical protein